MYVQKESMYHSDTGHIEKSRLVDTVLRSFFYCRELANGSATAAGETRTEHSPNRKLQRVSL